MRMARGNRPRPGQRTGRACPAGQDAISARVRSAAMRCASRPPGLRRYAAPSRQAARRRKPAASGKPARAQAVTVSCAPAARAVHAASRMATAPREPAAGEVSPSPAEPPAAPAQPAPPQYRETPEPEETSVAQAKPAIVAVQEEPAPDAPPPGSAAGVAAAAGSRRLAAATEPPARQWPAPENRAAADGSTPDWAQNCAPANDPRTPWRNPPAVPRRSGAVGARWSPAAGSEDRDAAPARQSAAGRAGAAAGPAQPSATGPAIRRATEPTSAPDPFPRQPPATIPPRPSTSNAPRRHPEGHRPSEARPGLCPGPHQGALPLGGFQGSALILLRSGDGPVIDGVRGRPYKPPPATGTVTRVASRSRGFSISSECRIREAHLPAVQACPQAPARFPRPHGHGRRSQGSGQSPRQGPQASVGLT